MRFVVTSAKGYDRQFLGPAAAAAGHEAVFLEPRLVPETAILARGFSAVCPFVNDSLSAEVLAILREVGVRFLALRSAGFNHVDLAAAERLGLRVAHVPAYSPHAVAEHAVGMILTLNRKFHKAHQRTRDGNFALEGLLGFDLFGQTVGVVGTGKIGALAAKILHGFGCRVLMHDRFVNEGCKPLGEYVDLDRLLAESDIVTLHCPLTPETRHLIDDASLARMKHGAMLINTSRGALVDAAAAITALKTGRLGHLGIDVYEEEADLFFDDHSDEILHDDVLARLLTFPNVIVTAHQAFFTRNALQEIARTTVQNLAEFEQGRPLTNEVSAARLRRS